MTFRSLFCEFETVTDAEGKAILQDSVSLGRVAFWIIFGIMVYFWLMGTPIPPTMFDSWWIILLYNFSKKPIDWIQKNVTVTVGK